MTFAMLIMMLSFLYVMVNIDRQWLSNLFYIRCLTSMLVGGGLEERLLDGLEFFRNKGVVIAFKDLCLYLSLVVIKGY